MSSSRTTRTLDLSLTIETVFMWVVFGRNLAVYWVSCWFGCRTWLSCLIKETQLRKKGQMKGFVSVVELVSSPLSLAKYKIAMTTTMLQILYLQSTISQHYGKWGGQTTQNRVKSLLGNPKNLVQAHLIAALLLYLVTETLWEPKNVLKTRDNPHLLDDHKQFVPHAPSLKIVSRDYPQVWHLINKGHLKISWHCLVNKHLSQNESPSATPYSHIPHSHTICNPGQTWGWLTGSANMFLSWLPSFKLWPHLHIIRAGGRHSDQDQTPPQRLSSPNILPLITKTGNPEICNTPLHIINPSQSSQ